MSDDRCPFCKSVVLVPTISGDIMRISCPFCGEFGIGAEDYRDVPETLLIKDEAIPAVRHAVARLTSDHSRPVITLATLERIISDARLPRHSEQLDNLIIWLGENLEGRPNESFEFDARRATAIVGSNTIDAFHWIGNHAFKKGLISKPQSVYTNFARYMGLTFEGWDKYFGLKEVRQDSRTAFMAMDFNDQSMFEVYKNCFQPAVDATGYELRTVSEKPKAGLIDNRMRVEIRNAKFLIADLTHDNNGAYWEAGFAEGLGKRVFYTCEKSKFENVNTHFDTSHQHTILWESDNLPDAAEELKAVIRNTLPGEAKMSDN